MISLIMRNTFILYKQNLLCIFILKYFHNVFHLNNKIIEIFIPNIRTPVPQVMKFTVLCSPFLCLKSMTKIDF